MTWTMGLALMVAVVLGLSLLAALLFPEKFS